MFAKSRDVDIILVLCYTYNDLVFERSINVKRSRYISLLLAAIMLFAVLCMPLSVNAAIDLSEHNLTTGQKYFLRVIGSLSRADYYQTNVLGSVTLAQGIYESGWGRSSLSVGGNNLFGIKAYSTWNGMVYDQKTSTLYSCYEDYLFSEGQGHINTYSAWRAHSSWTESVAVHSSLFINESKYAAVIGESDYKVAAKAIVDAGYCNDDGYADTIIKLIEQYGLDEYDDITPDEDGVVAVVTKQERMRLDIGESYTVPLTFYPETAVSSSVKWASDNEEIASVDENGNVTALAHGTTLITATLENGREACCIVYVDCNATVIEDDVKIYTAASQSSANVGKIYRGNGLKVTDSKLYTDVNGEEFYKVSGYNSKDVLVGGYALAEDIYLNKRNVNVISAVSEDITIKLGDSYTVKTAVSPADAVDTTLSWESDNTAVATVSEGVITAKKLGTATVTAKAVGGTELKIKVTVANDYREYSALISAYENLSVRSEPSSDASRVGKLDYLSKATVIGEAQGCWYKIRGVESDGDAVTGYANVAYVRIIEDENSVTYGTASEGVGIYKQSNTDSLSFGKLKEGSKYAVLSTDDEGWSYIVGIKTTNSAVHGYAKLGDFENDNNNNNDTPDNNIGSDSVPAGSYYGRTTTNLYVRSGANEDYSALGQFAENTQIIITGEAVDGWYPVMGVGNNGVDLSGYSSAKYITVLYSGTVTASALNVRAEPVSGSVVGRFNSGDKIIVVGEEADEWYSVESLDGSIVGYCKAEYIDINGKFTVSPEQPEQPEQGFIILDNSLSISEGVLYGVKLNTTVEALLKCFSGDVKVTDNSGNVLANDALVGTDSRITVTVNGTTEEVASVLVMGDVDGDGTVTTYDYLYIKRHFFETYELKGLCYEAALVSGEEELNVLDYVFVKRHYFGTYKIS